MKEKQKNKTLVIGASLRSDRYSNLAIHRLRDHGEPTVAIGLKPGMVANVPISTIQEDFEDIATVSLYLNPLRQKAYYDYVVGLNPKRVIFNPGTENPEFYAKLEAAGIATEVACTLVLLSTKQYQS